MTKKGVNQKKLELNKQTVSNLANSQMNDIKAGKLDPCWENIWTLYHCDVVYTGNSPAED